MKYEDKIKLGRKKQNNKFNKVETVNLWKYQRGKQYGGNYLQQQKSCERTKDCSIVRGLSRTHKGRG